MSGVEQSASAPHAAFDRAIWRRFWAMTGGFWRGAGARRAWLLTGALAASLVCRLLIDIGANSWQRWFFDALERRDTGSASRAVLVFIGIVICIGLIGMATVLSREHLQVRWREWCSTRLLDRWMANQRFFRLAQPGGAMQNPEYRISDDVRLATEPLTDFAIGLFTAALAATAFVVVLWRVGGSLDVRVGAVSFSIPAFMVIGALIYGVTASVLVPLAGRGLAGAAAAKNEAEARFRSDMIRMRENAAPIVESGGDGFSRRQLGVTYDRLVQSWIDVVRQHGRLALVMNANGSLILVAPLLFAAPKYLAGQLTLGEMMQLASAFVQVQLAIAWLADNYLRIAEWFASVRRIVELDDAFVSTDEDYDGGAPRLAQSLSADGAVSLTGALFDRTGAIVIHNATARLAPGERALIAGETAAERGALARAFARLWPWGDGALAAPDDTRIAFASAYTYLPEGALADALLYPRIHTDQDDDEVLRAALRDVGLRSLSGRLRDVARWDHSLSPTERQRLGFARVLLRRPTLIVLEDALGVFDHDGQMEMLDAIEKHCPHATVVNIGGRGSAARRFARTLTLTRQDNGDITLIDGQTPSALVRVATMGERKNPAAH